MRYAVLLLAILLIGCSSKEVDVPKGVVVPDAVTAASPECLCQVFGYASEFGTLSYSVEYLKSDADQDAAFINKGLLEFRTHFTGNDCNKTVELIAPYTISISDIEPCEGEAELTFYGSIDPPPHNLTVYTINYNGDTIHTGIIG